MNFLDRNTLPKFQERLDLAASELNNMEEILCKAINELAGRYYIVNNMIMDPEERAKYSAEPNFLILDKIAEIQTKIESFQSELTTIHEDLNNAVQETSDKYLELEQRLNTLDDAAARKEDLNSVLYRTGRE